MVKSYANSQEYIKYLSDPSGYCDLGRFTVINNSLRHENELGEIVAATGAQQVVDVVTTSPARIALLNTMAIALTEVRMSEENMDAVVLHLYEKASKDIEEYTKTALPEIESDINSQINQSFERLKNRVLDRDNPVDVLIERTYNQIKDKIDKGSYVPGAYNAGETLDSVVSKVVFDKLYKDKVYTQVESIVEKSINNSIDLGETVSFKSINSEGKEESHDVTLQRLSKHSGANRHTFIVAGPPACGKGGVSAMMELDARDLGIDFDDVAKINTDFNRGIVSLGQPLGPDKTMHANLNNDEASMVTDLVYERLNRMVDKGEAPHVLLDTVKFRGAKIDYGVKNQGTVIAKMITLDPEVAVGRAIKRGERIGRYVPAEYMLEAHKNLPSQLNQAIESYPGANMRLSIYDNNVGKGELPALVETVDFREKSIHIADPIKQAAIYGRKDIHTAPPSRYIYGSGEVVDSKPNYLSYVYGKQGRQLDFTFQQHGAVGYKTTVLPIDTHARASDMTMFGSSLQLGSVLYKISQGAVEGLSDFIRKSSGEVVSSDELSQKKLTLIKKLNKAEQDLNEIHESFSVLLFAKKEELDRSYQESLGGSEDKRNRYELLRREYQEIQQKSDDVIDKQFNTNDLNNKLKDGLNHGVTKGHLRELEDSASSILEYTSNIAKEIKKASNNISDEIKSEAKKALKKTLRKVEDREIKRGAIDIVHEEGRSH